MGNGGRGEIITNSLLLRRRSIATSLQLLTIYHAQCPMPNSQLPITNAQLLFCKFQAKAV